MAGLKADPTAVGKPGNPVELYSGRATFNQYETGIDLKGMTRKELQEKVGVRYDQANKRVYYFPTDLIASNGFANSTNLAPPTTPGQWGSIVLLSGPGFVRFDLSVVKKTYIKEAMNLELRAEFFDAFNNINFLTPTAGVLARRSVASRAPTATRRPRTTRAGAGSSSSLDSTGSPESSTVV